MLSCRAVFFNDLFVVPDVLTPPLAVPWCAAIAGSRVNDAEFIRSKGSGGICVKYIPASDKKKFVWMSAAFRTTYPGSSHIIAAFCGRGGGWKPLPDLRAFLLRECMKSTARSHIAGLVVPEDVAEHPELARIRGMSNGRLSC